MGKTSRSTPGWWASHEQAHGRGREIDKVTEALSVTSERADTSGSPRSATRFRISPDVVYNRTGDDAVIVNVRTNRIYQLNPTSARLWELISAGNDRSDIERLMLQEFDVTEMQLRAEIDNLVAVLKDESLVAPESSG